MKYENCLIISHEFFCFNNLREELNASKVKCGKNLSVASVRAFFGVYPGCILYCRCSVHRRYTGLANYLGLLLVVGA